MPRAPNPLEKKAEKLYRDGMKTPQIAEKLKVPAGTVRRWKAAGNWDSERSESSDIVSTKEVNARKKQGAPPGNKNAKGNNGGAPPGNKNNYRHGFYYDALEPEEKAFADEHSPITEAERLLNELDLWEIKERRLMRKLAELRAVPTGLAAQSVTKSKDGTSTTAVSTNEYILRYDTLLTQAQRAHVRCIQALHSIKMDIEKLQLAKLQAGVGPDSAEDEATQKALLKSITEAIGDDH